MFFLFVFLVVSSATCRVPDVSEQLLVLGLLTVNYFFYSNKNEIIVN